MSEAVKTNLLKAIEAMLVANLPEVLTVRRDWLFPFDLAALDAQGNPVTPLPGLFFYEDSEDLGTLGSQVAKNIIPLDLVVFAAFSEPVYTENSPAWQNFKDWADSLAGQIHGLWQNRALRLPLKAAGLIHLEELGNRKAPSNENYGEMVLTYRLTYGHALGDAFTTAIP
jgi:hypothetical protein